MRHILEVLKSNPDQAMPKTQPKRATSETKIRRKRLLLVDDHPVFRAGLASLIRGEDDWEVCGEADDAAGALSLIERDAPDLVLMDMSLPGRSGLELIKDARCVMPRLVVLVISMHDEAVYAERVIRAGGRGYIMKQAGPDKILQAIRRVLTGAVFVSEAMSARILDSLSGAPSSSSLAALTDREFEVFNLIGRGLEPQQIADSLNLSIKTVDTHRASIRRKLDLKNGTELIHRAAKWNDERV
jgi:DNA-binding NarL/FixJ family response regulator